MATMTVDTLQQPELHNVVCTDVAISLCRSAQRGE